MLDVGSNVWVVKYKTMRTPYNALSRYNKKRNNTKKRKKRTKPLRQKHEDTVQRLEQVWLLVWR